MKIAITATSPDIDLPFDTRFGRCEYFILFEFTAKNYQILANPALVSPGGAGPQAAEFIINQGVESVISGDFGPKAYSALDAARVSMYIANQGSVFDVLREFLTGQLPPAIKGRNQIKHYKTQNHDHLNSQW